MWTLLLGLSGIDHVVTGSRPVWYGGHKDQPRPADMVVPIRPSTVLGPLRRNTVDT